MKIRIALASLLLASGARAGTAEFDALNQKQALLTSQLNFTEKVAETHGRYVVVRDLYLNGPTGLFQTSAGLFTDIQTWLKAWSEGLNSLTKADWVKSLEDPKLAQFLDLQARKLEEIALRYERMKSLAYKGKDILEKQPRLNLVAFEKEAAKNSGDALFINQFKGHVEFFNGQLDKASELLYDSVVTLEMPEQDIILGMRDLSEQIYANIRTLTALKKMQYPELEAKIVAVEKMLGTDKALEPFKASATAIYVAGLQDSTQADFLAAEQRILALESYAKDNYTGFEGSAYDQNRVKQAKALLTLQMNDLKKNIQLKIAAEGGRAEALRAFIQKRGAEAEDSPLAYCQSYDGQLSAYRHYYDCNLFRKNIAPLLPVLEKLNEGQLEVVAKSLKSVYEGPLSKGDLR